MKLYEYFRSSCSYRLRIALNIKGLDAEKTHINLLKNEQFSDGYKAINPQSSVPTLVDGNTAIYQSLAAIEYLDETYPDNPLLPKGPAKRAKVRSIALAIVADMQPLNNISVLNYLVNELGISEEQKLKWYKHWINKGLGAIEPILSISDKYCHRDSVTLADICLIPQVYNALRFKCDTSAFPKIMRIYETCNQLPAFEQAKPENHPDFVG
ncbi:MAG: nagL 1 [Rickettsiaceae bacterium]|jgi:maleylacetoacetate isomerase|nr:nagL 1 [Rickettsiaceae bacterium]